MPVFTIEPYVKKLNKYDTYPIVSNIFSAPLRFIAGLIQLTVAPLFALYTAMQNLIKHHTLCSADLWQNWQEIKNGFTNIFRAFIASLFIIGNAILWCYDRSCIE